MGKRPIEYSADMVKAAFDEGYREGHMKAVGYRLSNEDQNRDIETAWAASVARVVTDAARVESDPQMNKIRRGVHKVNG